MRRTARPTIDARARARATVGLLRRGWRHSSSSSRKGVHIARHILPYWADGVAELEQMIALWIGAGPSLTPDSQEEAT